MVLILLEALGALLALVLIVWWTMFSGRQNGELPPHDAEPAAGDETGTPKQVSGAPGNKPATPRR